MDDIKAVYRTDISGIKNYEFGQAEENDGDKDNKAMTAMTNKSNNKSTKYEGTCGYCHKYGHKTQDCFHNPKSTNYRGDKGEKMTKNENNNGNGKSKFFSMSHLWKTRSHRTKLLPQERKESKSIQWRK